MNILQIVNLFPAYFAQHSAKTYNQKLYKATRQVMRRVHSKQWMKCLLAELNQS